MNISWKIPKSIKRFTTNIYRGKCNFNVDAVNSFKTMTWILSTSLQDSCPQSWFSLIWVIFESKLKITCHFFSHCLCTCKFTSLWQESCSWVTFSCYSLACRLCRESCCLTSLLQYQSTLGMMEFPNGACDLYLSEEPEPVMLNLSVPDDKSVFWVMAY